MTCVCVHLARPLRHEDCFVTDGADAVNGGFVDHLTYCRDDTTNGRTRAANHATGYGDGVTAGSDGRIYCDDAATYENGERDFNWQLGDGDVGVGGGRVGNM